MKKGNVLLKVIAVLAIILLSLISFLGIYRRNLNMWENVIPKFQFSKELGETRIYEFIVDTKSTKKVPNPNASTDTTEDNTNNEQNSETAVESSEESTQTTEGENVEQSSEEANGTEEDLKTIDVPVNDQSALTTENYKKSKKIIENRLRDYGITDTTVSVDENDGKIVITAPYEDSSKYLIDLMTTPGKIEIVDTDTSEVLIPESMINKATVYYQQSDTTSLEDDEVRYNLGVRLSFNSEGQKKLREISKNYIEKTDEEGNSTQKTITVKLDDKDRFTTWFPAEGEFTELPMKLYDGVSADDEDNWNKMYNDCVIIQNSINSETLPIVYRLNTGTFIESEISNNFVKYLSILGIIILAIVAIISIVKYKKLGIFIALIEVAYIAIHLLLIRLAGVKLAISGLLTIAFMAFANYILLRILVTKEKVIEKIDAFGKFIIALIPFIITMIVFTLGKEINVQSIGMVGIWGTLTFACTIVASIILLNSQKKNGVENNEK